MHVPIPHIFYQFLNTVRDRINKTEIGRACSTCEGDAWFRRGRLRGGINEKTILKCIFEKWNEGHGLDRSGSAKTGGGLLLMR